MDCRSPYSEDDIGLISEEEFAAKAPESLKAGIEDKHQLMLNRLRHEKQERLDLVNTFPRRKNVLGRDHLMHSVNISSQATALYSTSTSTFEMCFIHCMPFKWMITMSHSFKHLASACNELGFNRRLYGLLHAADTIRGSAIKERGSQPDGGSQEAASR